MSRISSYEDFVARVEELGFMSLFPAIPGLPSVEDETPPGIWFQDDTTTDPWNWKSRVAEEKRLAYGCLLGGIKGFVAPRMYGHFHAAFHLASVESRWKDGVLSPLAWKAWSQFDARAGIGTRELCVLCGVKSGRLDSVLADLQRTYDLTVAGREYRLDRSGRPYGWPSNRYETVGSWVPEEWWSLSDSRDRKDAAEAILAAAAAFGTGIDAEGLVRRWKLEEHPRNLVP